MNAQYFFLITPLGSILALVFAYYFYNSMMSSDPGSERSREIAGYVKEGAMSYLWSQYRIVGLFFVIAFVFFAFLAFVLGVLSPWTPIAFLLGGFFSGLAGYLGMVTATNASNRTASACVKSLNQGLTVAFRSGAVMGLVVVGFALLDVSFWWTFLNWVMSKKDTIFAGTAFAVHSYEEITRIMVTFGMGASAQALFSRVGGGIFTKAADVGADLVGKTEAGIPEDDPRNPAVIADNVGDNVGDVAGMGADLYESYYGSLLATTALGAAAFSTAALKDFQLGAIILPFAIAGAGAIASLIGVHFVGTSEDATQKDLMSALSHGINVAAGLAGTAAFILTYLLLPEHIQIFGSIVVGIASGIIIGWATEYYTSAEFDPTKEVAAQTSTGPATVIIEGLATGMISTGIPVVAVCFAILFAYGFAGGFTDPTMGLYGIGIAAVGMLSTLGITLATDAYGPIADNAGGNAEMSNLGAEVRKRTDTLDSLGNTTAATGKGFAIGSAALTTMALLGAYAEGLRHGLMRIAKASGDLIDSFIFIGGNPIKLEFASINDFMIFYDITLMNPRVLVGVFIGSLLVFLFCAMTMKAVGRAAHSMVEEVRRQFREIPGLLKGEEGVKADYKACVAISTQGAQREMTMPSLLAIIVPILTGLILGPGGVMGLLVGGLSTGFVMAIMMANAGGSWDNAKKYIESGQLGGKGSSNHKAAVVGDTVGDPFKDTSGPSLNILIKLMSMVAVVVSGLTVAYSPMIQQVLGFNPPEVRAMNEARKMHQEGTINLSDEKSGTPVRPFESGMLDKDDPLLGYEEAILPEDEEGLFEEEEDSEPVINTAEASETKTTTGSSDFGSGGFDSPEAAKTDSLFDSGGFDDESGAFDDVGDKSASNTAFTPADDPFDTEAVVDDKASGSQPVTPEGDKPSDDNKSSATGGFDDF